MEEKGIEKTEVTGVGVGVPGPVVKEREVQVAVNLHWGYTMLADDLEKLLDQIPVKVGNDANVAAWYCNFCISISGWCQFGNPDGTSEE